MTIISRKNLPVKLPLYMVPPPGLEPGRTRREILSLLCLPIPPWRLGASEENRTLISRLSGATGYKSAVLPLNYRGVLLLCFFC
jgi:hypothetical protein